MLCGFLAYRTLVSRPCIVAEFNVARFALLSAAALFLVASLLCDGLQRGLSVGIGLSRFIAAGLWLLASDASAAAELLNNDQFGSLLQCQQRSDWPLQLQQLNGHDHPPAPLLQFPPTQPNLTDVLESLHKRLGIWADQRKPVL